MIRGKLSPLTRNPSTFNWFTNIDIIIAHSFIDFRNFFTLFHPLYCSSIFNNSINHLNLSHQFTFSPTSFRLVTNSIHGVRGDVNKPIQDIFSVDQVPSKTAKALSTASRLAYSLSKGVFEISFPVLNYFSRVGMADKYYQQFGVMKRKC